MRHKILLVLLCILWNFPCMLCADEMEIQLQEVVSMSPVQGDEPFDNSGKEGHVPTRPTDFRATIDGNALSITKEDETIPIAQAIVANASTGGIVLNQQFTNTLQEQIPNAGTYALRIETASGALVGQFIVQ